MKILRVILAALLMAPILGCPTEADAQSIITGQAAPYAGGIVTVVTTGFTNSTATLDTQGNFTVQVTSNPSSHNLTFTPLQGSAYSPFTITVTAPIGTTNITTQITAAIPPPAPTVFPALSVTSGAVNINSVQYEFPDSNDEGCLTNDGDGGLAWDACGSAGGGLTSVGLSMPTWLAVANTPLVANGVIAVTPASAQTSHQVIGTCGTGTTFGPCTLVAADIPSIGFEKILSGSNNTGLVMTSGGVFSYSGTGIINANELLGVLLSSLGNGIYKFASGVPSLATAGTDYVIPSGNISGTAANLSGTPALPNGVTGTTQTVGDNTTKLATDAFVIANAGSGSSGITGGVAGYFTLYGSATTITAPAPCDYNITNALAVTCTVPQYLNNSSGASVDYYIPTSTAPTTSAGAFGFGAPATVSTANTVVGFEAPCSGVWTLANTSGVMDSTCTAIIPDFQITVSSGTSVASGVCSSETALAVANVTTASAFFLSGSTDLSAVTGWSPAGSLYFMLRPTSGNVNWRVCNDTAATLVTGASATFNGGGK